MKRYELTKEQWERSGGNFKAMSLVKKHDTVDLLVQNEYNKRILDLEQ